MSIKISLSLWLGVLAVVAEIHGQGQPSYQQIHLDVGNNPDSNTGPLLTDLNNGANPDSLGPNGWTPLHIAAGLNKPEMAKLLKQKNANLNIKDASNYAPLHIAAGVDSDGVIDKLVPGANTEIKGPSDWTPLHVAAGNGKVNSVQELLKNANKNPVDVNGWTPLHIAVGMNKLLVAEELLDKSQTNKNAKDNMGYTPLHIAAGNNRPAMVTLLLSKGVSTTILDNAGKTAKQEALSLGYTATAALIP